MENDKYSNIAETYDYMLVKNNERESFFLNIFQENNIKTILDCACGTGKDLVLFDSLGIKTSGSDISDSMLKIAQKRIDESGLIIPIISADFQKLELKYSSKFDAVVCLSNAINEPEVDVIKALNSMKNVLNKHGIIIIDQGQTDMSIKNGQKYSLEVNNKDFSRLYTMDYLENIMTVNIYDLVHNNDYCGMNVNIFKIKIRLYDEWVRIMDEAQLDFKIYGNWDFSPYKKENGKRLIIVGRKK